MLARLIRSVRQKPKPIRDQYAFWTAILFTVLVGGVWGFGLSGSVNTDVSSVQQPDSAGVFSSFFDEIGGKLSEVTDSISAISEPEESSPVVATSSVRSTSSQPLDMNAIFATSTPVAEPGERSVRIATTSASTTQ
jgi:hypothetical protein